MFTLYQTLTLNAKGRARQTMTYGDFGYLRDEAFFREILSISGIISCHLLQEVFKRFQDYVVAKIGLQPHRQVSTGTHSTDNHTQTDCYNPLPTSSGS